MTDLIRIWIEAEPACKRKLPKMQNWEPPPQESKVSCNSSLMEAFLKKQGKLVLGVQSRFLMGFSCCPLLDH